MILLYFFTQTGEVDTKSIDTNMFSMDKDAVSEVQLIKQDLSMIMTKGENGWELDNYPVDTTRLGQLLDQFSELTPDRMITKNPEKQKKRIVACYKKTLVDEGFIVEVK